MFLWCSGITFPLHGKGHRFEPGWEQFFHYFLNNFYNKFLMKKINYFVDLNILFNKNWRLKI